MFVMCVMGSPAFTHPQRSPGPCHGRARAYANLPLRSPPSRAAAHRPHARAMTLFTTARGFSTHPSVRASTGGGAGWYVMCVIRDVNPPPVPIPSAYVRQSTAIPSIARSRRRTGPHARAASLRRPLHTASHPSAAPHPCPHPKHPTPQASAWRVPAGWDCVARGVLSPRGTRDARMAPLGSARRGSSARRGHVVRVLSISFHGSTSFGEGGGDGGAAGKEGSKEGGEGRGSGVGMRRLDLDPGES
ncbi:hypothetical protein BJ912DRAFT_419384 [Pholiota molesta]|nr:hypothetical protein BJ912DRAFT_419384 [Pholiota molesta]